jgi:ABC-2 type transport system ATP-binding protein
MSVAVTVDHLTIVLGKKFEALRDVSLELPVGKITGFIGPSGAGKTTLIRAIVGRQKLNKGTITIFGQPAGSATLRPQLRYMTQEVAAYSDLTVNQNLRYFAQMLGYAGQEAKRAAGQALERVSLIDKAGVMVGSLSGGQKQRVSLAISLIGNPKLLVLDEPTVGLDPVLREELWGLFRQLSSSGVTVIVSSHVMDEAERCDDLVLIRDGEIVAHDSPSDLRRRTGTQTVEQSFLKLAGRGVA